MNANIFMSNTDMLEFVTEGPHVHHIYHKCVKSWYVSKRSFIPNQMLQPQNFPRFQSFNYFRRHTNNLRV